VTEAAVHAFAKDLAKGFNFIQEFVAIMLTISVLFLQFAM